MTMAAVVVTVIAMRLMMRMKIMMMMMMMTIGDDDVGDGGGDVEASIMRLLHTYRGCVEAGFSPANPFAQTPPPSRRSCAPVAAPPWGGGGGYRSDAGEAPAAFLNTPSGVQKKKLGRGAGRGKRRRGEEADGS